MLNDIRSKRESVLACRLKASDRDPRCLRGLMSRLCGLARGAEIRFADSNEQIDKRFCARPRRRRRPLR